MTDADAGQTPQPDMSGCKLPVYTRDQINAAEAANQASAADWIENGRRLPEIISVPFLQQLHMRMLSDVWQWAGTYRTVDLTIGVPANKVPYELNRVAFEFRQDWDAGWPLIPFIASYHHRLVWVHPWPDGNGRWARLACDAVVRRLAKAPPLIWTTGTLRTHDAERADYIAALQAADGRDIQPLCDYLHALNPDR